MRFLFIALILFAPLAEACKLPDGKTLRIACTKACGQSYVNALNASALRLGYKIDIVTLHNIREMEFLDGFLSPGGHDIETKYFEKNLNPDEKLKTRELFGRLANDGHSTVEQSQRDKFEAEVLRHYQRQNYLKNTPYLGVCYGMQMMAADQGLPLVIDINEQLKIPNRRRLVDQITVDESSTLYPASRGRLDGYKNHHQCIDMNYWRKNKAKHPNVRITATSNGGRIAEVLEWTHRPALGIQFHAEKSTGVSQKAPYDWFLMKACQKKMGGKTRKAESSHGNTAT